MEGLSSQDDLQGIIDRIDRGPGPAPDDYTVLREALAAAADQMLRVHGSVDPLLGDVFRIERGL